VVGQAASVFYGNPAIGDVIKQNGFSVRDFLDEAMTVIK
jgi:hypothetical protein